MSDIKELKELDELIKEDIDLSNVSIKELIMDIKSELYDYWFDDEFIRLETKLDFIRMVVRYFVDGMNEEKFKKYSESKSFMELWFDVGRLRELCDIYYYLALNKLFDDTHLKAMNMIMDKFHYTEEMMVKLLEEILNLSGEDEAYYHLHRDILDQLQLSGNIHVYSFLDSIIIKIALSEIGLQSLRLLKKNIRQKEKVKASG